MKELSIVLLNEMALEKYNFDYLNIFFKMNFTTGINLFKIALLFPLLTLNKYMPVGLSV